MLTTLDWALIVLYLLLSLGIGLMYARRAGSSLNEYFLSGRDTPWWLAGLSMVATTFAADTPLAVTELTRTSGIAGNWLWWNMLAGGTLTTFFFARYWRRAGVLTDLEIITLRYSGKAAHFLRGLRAVYLGVVMNTLIIGWVNLAMASILKVYFKLDDNQALLAVGGCMLLTTVYASLSGLRGVLITDAVQFCIAMAGCIVLAVVVVNSDTIGGLSGLVQKVPAGALDFLPSLNATNAASTLVLGFGSFIAFAGVQWWASWYPGAEPGGGGYVAQRIMASKTEADGLAATLLFQVLHYAARPWPWVLVALSSLVLYPTLSGDEAKLGYLYAMRDHLPPGLQGLLLVAFFAAYMSTLSTQLNWGTSYLLNDLYKAYLNPAASEKHMIRVARIATGILMLFSLAVTTQLSSIAGAWQFLLECGAGAGLALILRWYWWRINAWSEIVATLMPFVCMGTFKLMAVLNLLDAAQWAFPNSYLVTVTVTVTATVLAAYLLPGTDAPVLRAFYARVWPQGWWGPYATKPLASQTPIWVLGTCWLASIVLVYAQLFAIGKFLFLQPLAGLGLTALAAASAGVLWALARRYPIFS